ncbi:MAG TPA: prolyl oligopeptidase family serine peptidase [Lapillicoccus sp.]|nr:prolyl oligopeptidase family serine peptidase [Lapillicoccus sp.]
MTRRRRRRCSSVVPPDSSLRPPSPPSPISYVSAEAAPLLLVHGLDDQLVPPQQSVLLHEALRRVGAVSELDQVESAGHVLYGVDVDPIADRSADFLVRHLH